VLISTDADSMKAHELKYDFILITIPDAFDINDYVPLIKRDGALTTVGLLGEYKAPLNNMEMAMHRRSVSASIIGSIAETQEILDFCAEHDIAPEVEMIKMQDINDAFDKMMDKEVRFRYVIDMASLKDEE
jgi:uncharacterized zinc-type alcohol dehydrogenase-like protein